MSGKNPFYDFKDFIDACSKGNVSLWKSATEGAEKFFNLKTKKDLLEFIANEGLTQLEFINSASWKENPKPEKEILIDAYKFRSGGTLGYIAFFYSPYTQNWIIKSFKQNLDTNVALKEAINKALQKKQ